MVVEQTNEVHMRSKFETVFVLRHFISGNSRFWKNLDNFFPPKSDHPLRSCGKFNRELLIDMLLFRGNGQNKN